MTVPPKVVRRLVLAPFVFLLSLALIALSPVFFLIALIVDLIVRGGFRSVRLVAFGVAYLIYELAGLLVMPVLWLRAGFGTRLNTAKMQDLNYAFQRWWLRGINGAARACFRLRIVIEDRPQPTPGPVLVFSRHAGPGNSLMLVGTLMVGYDRRPRVVMLEKLQWEPLFDIMLNRLPNKFIGHDPAKRDHVLQAIAELASGLGDRDAYVLFPEGHDFTPRLRLKAIAHLLKGGREEHARKAEQMQYVLPPKTGGAITAITAAPEADVVFVAHTVLEDVGAFRNLWSRMPLKGPIYSRYWRIPAAEVPRDRDQLTEWLFEWWERIDRWVHDRMEPLEAAGTAEPSGRSS